MVFEVDFPSAGLTEDQAVVRIIDRGSSRRTELIRFLGEPNKNAGIEQQRHGLQPPDFEFLVRQRRETIRRIAHWRGG